MTCPHTLAARCPFERSTPHCNELSSIRTVTGSSRERDSNANS